MNTRQKRNTQNRSAESIRITERDLWILEALAKMRFLTTRQLAQLYFNESRWSANKRLRKLFDSGAVKVWVRSLSQENVYSVTRKGLGILEKKGFIVNDTARVPRGPDGNLDHLLAINQVRVALAVGLPEVVGEIRWWKSDWELRAPGSSRIIPDALFGIRWHGEQEQSFSLELDNQTKSPRKFLKKILGYSSLNHQVKNLYGVTDFVTLVVGKDPRWLERYRMSLRQTRLGSRIWFATLEALENGGAAGRIWKSADDEKTYSLQDLGFFPYGKERDGARK